MVLACDPTVEKEMVELIPGRFFFAALKTAPSDSSVYQCFCIDDQLQYEPFCEDFGPLNLAQLHLYTQIVQTKLAAAILQGKKIVHYSVGNEKTLTNFATLAGLFVIMNFKKDPHYIHARFFEKHQYMEFNDASMDAPIHTISMKNLFTAAQWIKKSNFVDFNDFCYADYVHYETVQNGDMNWMVPQKLLAFAGPQTRGPHPTSAHDPASYIPYFKAFGITTIIRLNNHLYDAEVYTSAGFNHFDIIFTDGGTPSDDQLQFFLEIVEQSYGAVAVHCKAGLGRTGTLIAAYIMKWFHFTSREAIAWCRMCRPASIIGPQQQYLFEKQSALWSAGPGTHERINPFGVYSYNFGVNYHWNKNKKNRNSNFLDAKIVRKIMRKISPNANQLPEEESEEDDDEDDPDIQEIPVYRKSPELIVIPDEEEDPEIAVLKWARARAASEVIRLTKALKREMTEAEKVWCFEFALAEKRYDTLPISEYLYIHGDERPEPQLYCKEKLRRVIEEEEREKEKLCPKNPHSGPSTSQLPGPSTSQSPPARRMKPSPPPKVTTPKGATTKATPARRCIPKKKTPSKTAETEAAASAGTSSALGSCPQALRRSPRACDTRNVKPKTSR